MSKNLGANAQLYLKIGKLFDKLMNMDWEPSADCHVWRYYSSTEHSIAVDADFGNRCVNVKKDDKTIESFDFDSENLINAVIKLAKELM